MDYKKGTEDAGGAQMEKGGLHTNKAFQALPCPWEPQCPCALRLLALYIR